MTTQLLSPLDMGNATQVGGKTFRKQILPIGSINYQGRRIDFTREKLEQMAQAFRESAYDAVPLVFADGDNRHTMSPTAATGEVVGMEVTDDGLDVIVQASDEAATLLSQHPRVGISARIMENLQRADGKFFPAAIQHALITWDPRITGMRPWQAVDLSADPAGEVLDLTGLTFTPESALSEEETMPQFTDEEYEQLRALLTMLNDTPSEPTPSDPAGEEGEFDEDYLEVDDNAFTDADLDGELSVEELNALAAEALNDAPQEVAASTPAAPSLDLSTPAPSVTEFADARVGELETQLANVQAQLDERNYQAERDELVKTGIPPAVVDLAKPLLQGSTVVELSNGSHIDAGNIMREVFTELGRQLNLLDLSEPVFPPSDDAAAEADERKQWSQDALRQLGLR